MPPKEPPKKWKQPKGPKPVQRKNKNNIGLGRAIQHQRSKENAIEYLPDGQMRFTTDKHEANWVKLRSVTQESSLDEFLSTAQLANKDFSAERHSNVKIIRLDDGTGDSAFSQGFMLTNERKMALDAKQRSLENDLIVPRRPAWTADMTKYQLDRQENDAFLEWRRKLAHLQESNEDLLLTPFERNIEVWKQLWRVVERSDLVVQIVDARNPLLFRSVDLERYVKELNDGKQNLLLVNKADLLTLKQRIAWAQYFIARDISFTFYSALRANQLLELSANEGTEAQVQISTETHDAEWEEDAKILESLDDEVREKIKILTIDQLESLFLSRAPKESLSGAEGSPLQIGLVGYPNVGKSSTINSLVGAKKVSVSATPGKTKHFQTINLSERVVLCDCPGLVFPNFAYNKGELVCNGVLPIDQLRDHIAPSALVVERVPKYFLEAIYGIRIETPRADIVDDDAEVQPTAQELLVAYARARGYMTQGYGSADEARASRYILKDYVSGKLLYVNPPPHLADNAPYTREECREFNRDLYVFSRLPASRQEQLLQAARSKGLASAEIDLSRDLAALSFAQHAAPDTRSSANNIAREHAARTHGGAQAALHNAANDLDQEFFRMDTVTGHGTTPFHKQQHAAASKKHNKKNKKKRA